MLKRLFKIFFPPGSAVYKQMVKLALYKPWYPTEWDFDVLRSFAEYKKEVRFIQVGSNNGVSGDPLYEYVVAKNWSGLLVEPVPYLFAQLKENYQLHTGRLHFENSAVAAQNGTLPFYRLKESNLPNIPTYYDQLGSFNKEVILRHRSGIPQFDELFFQDMVETITFEKLVQKHQFHSADLIHIDTEGYDYEILKMIPFKKLAVQLIMFEHVHLNDKDYRSALKLLNRLEFKCHRSKTDTIGVQKGVCNKLRKY